MHDPLVSVIISTKNSSRTIDACLRSVQEQTYKNIKLIVVDNSSTDNSKDIARKYTPHVFDHGPERSAQRNFGAAHASGEYLLIHDSDIYFNPGSVEECVVLSQSQDCGAIILPEQSIGTGFWAKIKAFERSFYVGNDLIEAPRFFERGVFERLGGYDEQLTGPEDWDLGIRIRNAGYTIARAKFFVFHDEGTLTLADSIKKKKYYAPDMFGRYAEKHPREFAQQMNFFMRFPPGAIVKKGLSHPLLFGGMIVMKSAEYISSKQSV